MTPAHDDDVTPPTDVTTPARNSYMACGPPFATDNPDKGYGLKKRKVRDG
jgi:hypothetical protein